MGRLQHPVAASSSEVAAELSAIQRVSSGLCPVSQPCSDLGQAQDLARIESAIRPHSLLALTFAPQSIRRAADAHRDWPELWPDFESP